MERILQITRVDMACCFHSYRPKRRPVPISFRCAMAMELYRVFVCSCQSLELLKHLKHQMTDGFYCSSPFLGKKVTFQTDDLVHRCDGNVGAQSTNSVGQQCHNNLVHKIVE